MHTGTGRIVETLLEDGQPLVRISCPPNLIPAPGQYLLAGDASLSPLPVPLFYTESATESFIAVLPGGVNWQPGQEFALRGPLGRGFDLPASARKIALVALEAPPVRLRGLIRPALQQGAAIVVVTDFASERLPDEVEVQPLSGLTEVLAWADYAALDAARENLPRLKEKLGVLKQVPAKREAQIFVRTPVSCGGVAECGVCAVNLKSGWRLACKDGPVFEWGELI